MPFVTAFIIIIILLIILFSCIRVVPQAHVYVVERLGKYHATWEAGLHLKVPIIDQISRKISLKERVLDFKPQPVITKDNVTMLIDSVVYAKVFDAQKYTYGIDDANKGLQNLVATNLRSIVGAMELDQTLTSREDINSQMTAKLDAATDDWGLKVTRVEIKSIQPPKEIEEVMTKQMRAERERRQTVLEAQAHKESVVARAEGDKQAKELAAEAESNAQISLAKGKAEAIRLVYEAQAQGIEKLNQANVSEGVIRLKAIEALKDVSDGQATKIYMPTDLMDTVTNLGVLGDSLSDKKPIEPKSMPRDEYRKNLVPVKEDACVDEESSDETKSAMQTGQDIEIDIKSKDA